jgi:hypothetical protein
MTNPPPEQPKSTSLLQVIQAVAASFFGVQSDAARQRDFTRGKASHYIIVGLIATVVFIVTIVFIVKLVLRQAGM